MSGSVRTEGKSGSGGGRQRRIRAVTALFAACALLGSAGILAGASRSHAAVSSTLYAGFDADGNIHLAYTDGTMIGTPNPPGSLVPAGTYSIVVNNNGVDDLGNYHYFQLTGPGVSLSVGTNIYDTTTWTATFQPSSTYVYSDTNNPTTIHEVFGTPGSGAGTGTTTSPTVTATPGSPTGTTSKPKLTSNNPLVGAGIVPFRGDLTGSVSASGVLSLELKGKNVATLEAGRYKVSVADHSATSGFNLQEIRKSATAVTGTTFIGKRSVTVDLEAGQWFFYPTFIGKKSYFIVVAR